MNFMQPDEKLVTYCNRLISDGGTYSRVGLRQIGIISPDYYYDKSGQFAGHRGSWQKHMLEKKLSIFDQRKTECDNMLDNGYYRVWNCGQLIFELI